MITLQLTPDQALTLKVILMNIGGCPKYSARQYADDVLTQIRDAEWSDKLGSATVKPEIDPRYGKIYFLS